MLKFRIRASFTQMLPEKYVSHLGIFFRGTLPRPLRWLLGKIKINFFLIYQYKSKICIVQKSLKKKDKKVSFA